MNKDIDWLESATTMLSLYKNYNKNFNNSPKKDYDRLIKETKIIKHKIDEYVIKSACNDLKKINLFN
ncbi:MAG: hypothetical protein LBT66_08925 [Methanobrevibacter sp.]|jgi:hypothetical protein|nr:hypothetical protein [Candidatus Methanovirga meridionalis]